MSDAELQSSSGATDFVAALRFRVAKRRGYAALERRQAQSPY
jgi:hypothetical protein